MDPKQHEKVAVSVSTITIVINLALAGFKFLAGFLARSGAMISDAVHSASDVLATLIVILGVKLAGRDADRNHPYGHERLECVAALILDAVISMWKKGVKDKVGIAICLVMLFLSVFTDISPILLVIACALLGVAVRTPARRAAKGGESK